MTRPGELISRIETTYTIKLESAQPLDDRQLNALQGSGTLNRAEYGLQDRQEKENSYLLRLDKNPEALNRAINCIVGSGISLKHLEIRPATLEDVFLELTGNELRD